MRHHSPAHPTSLENTSEDEDMTGYESELIEPGKISHYSGLTIREHFAGLAMQALVSRSPYPHTEAAEEAVEYADALIAVLYPGDFEDETDEHSPEHTDVDGAEFEPSTPDAEGESPTLDELPLHIPT